MANLRVAIIVVSIISSLSLPQSIEISGPQRNFPFLSSIPGHWGFPPPRETTVISSHNGDNKSPSEAPGGPMVDESVDSPFENGMDTDEMASYVDDIDEKDSAADDAANDGIDGDDDDDADDDDENVTKIQDTSNFGASDLSRTKNSWQSEVAAGLKRIWRGFINEPPSLNALRNVLFDSPSGIDANESTAVVLEQLRQPPTAMLRVNGTDRTSFYRQLLAQFLVCSDAGSSSTERAMWLDQEFALVLKGAAVLAQFPELVNISASFGGTAYHSPRGVQLMSSSSSHSMQRQIVSCLAHSCGSRLLFLNRRVLDSVRQQAVACLLPKKLLSTSTILSTLLDMLEEQGRPTIVALTDDLSWLLRDQAASELLLDELTGSTSSAPSRNFFVSMKPDEELVVGQSVSSLRAQKQAEGANQQPQQQPRQPQPGNFPNFMNMFSGSPFPPSPPGGDSNDSPNPARPADQGTNENRPTGVPGGPFPGMPMNMMNMGRSFQLTMRNGTATLVPISSANFGMMPYPMPPGSPMMMGGSFPAGVPGGGQGMPPAMAMRRIAEEQQRRLQQMQQQQQQQQQQPPQPDDPLASLPFPFPEDMSVDDIREFIQNPENQAIIKDMMDRITQMILSQIPPELLQQASEEGNNGEAPRVEVKVHMVPMHMNPFANNGGMNPPNSNGKGIVMPSFPFLRPFTGKDKGTHAQQGAAPGKSEAADNSSNRDRRSKKVRGSSRIGSQSSDRGVPSSPSPDVISAAGNSLLGSFEQLTLDAPRDQGLRMLWDSMVDEEIVAKIFRRNRRLLIQGMRRFGFWDEMESEQERRLLNGLKDVLQRQVLSADEVRNAIAAAVRLQAGRFNAVSVIVGVGEGATASTSTATSTFSVPPMLLSRWALESALTAVMDGVSPRRRKPEARSKEEIASMVADKHEKELIPNIISPQEIGVTFDMVGGLGEAKETLRQCITYPLKYPRLYQEGIAAEAVKGVLLFGPPGTGKTMLAKAVATEGGATFLMVDASTIENKWLGESEKNAKAVFTLARRLAPCVVYLDEVDSVLASREHGDDSSHGTLTSVKTTLMQEWDGLRTTKDRVVVIASTNRPFDLDEAVLRRLPRRIMVDLPDCATRKEILAVTLAGNRLSADVNLTRIAESLEGYSGSDIKEVCREAVVRVAHERAQLLESGAKSTTALDEDPDPFSPLRAVTASDFREAMKKLKASVDDNGRELQKVMEWNEKYGEIKKADGKRGNKPDLHMSLYL